MLLSDDLSPEQRVDAYADLAAILFMVNALARKRNRADGKFADGYVLPHDWLLGERRFMPRDWKRFRSGESNFIGLVADVFGGDFQVLAPFPCDFVARTEIMPKRGTVGLEELDRIARAPARIITQAELGITWEPPEVES